MHTAAPDSFSDSQISQNDSDRRRRIGPSMPRLATYVWPDQPPPDPEGLGPLVCREYARLIHEYWQACQFSSELDPGACLDIIDLAPGSGLSSWLMVLAIRRHLGSLYRWRYLPLAPRRSWFSAIENSSELKEMIRKGDIVPLLWNPVRGDPCLLHPSGRRRWRAENPVVVIAHDRFAHLGQRLLAAHYGKLMLAEISEPKARGVSESSGEESPSVDWKILEGQPFDEPINELMKRYLQTFNSSPLPYPEGALCFINAIAASAPAGHMMLSMACGFDSEPSLRLSTFSGLLQHWRATRTLPVNFHMIAHHYKSLNGSAACLRIRPGQVLQIAVGGHSDSVERLTRLAAKSEPWLADQPASLIEATRALGNSPSLTVRLSLLRLSEYDPAVFMANDRALTAALANASRDGSLERAAWREALTRVALNQLPGPAATDLHQRLAQAAMHCGSWGLARDIITRGMKVAAAAATDLANLAWCENRTGNAAQGMALVQQALQIDPSHGLALEVHKRISEKLAARDQRWRQALCSPSADMTLEPLHVTHAEALYFQYRDPQIAIMTGLPPMKSIEEARSWIDAQAADVHKVNYAIMLPDEGFAGFINLAVSAHAAFFCFWAGVDFQGRGLAAMAGQLACAQAAKLGVPVILTSAFMDNQRSIRALRRMGFEELPIRALPPDHDRIFFILSCDPQAKANGIRELVEYYARESLSVQFPSHESLDAQTPKPGSKTA